MKSATILLLMPLVLWASFFSHMTFIPEMSEAMTGEPYQDDPRHIVARALEVPSEQTPLIIQKVINDGEDAMEAVCFFLEFEGGNIANLIRRTTLQKIERIIPLLPTVGGKCLIPCVSHHGSLYSVCSMVSLEELIPTLKLMASVSAIPPCSVDVWNIITGKQFWNFGSAERHCPEIVQAINILLDNGCPVNIPLIYNRYQEISHPRLEGCKIVPTSEIGWFNPVMHLLWIDEPLGKRYLAESLSLCRANPNEKIFSHTSFLGQNNATPRSILGHVLKVFALEEYFGLEYVSPIATILIAFGADIKEFFFRSPNALGGSLLDMTKQGMILKAHSKISQVKEKLWLLQLTHSGLGEDVRKMIAGTICDMIL